MVIDPDHLSVLARQQLLDVVERRGYSGVVSSHSWSTPDAIPRILRLGGVVTPMAGSTTEFLPPGGDQAAARPALLLGHRLGRRHERLRAPGRAARRAANVTYPFKSFDGRDDRQAAQRPARLRHQRRRRRPLRPVPRLGRGPAPDRRPGGRRRPRPRRRGVPADVGARRGVPPTRCQPAAGRATRRGLARVRLRAGATRCCAAPGQPRRRAGRTWTLVPRDRAAHPPRHGRVGARAPRPATARSAPGPASASRRARAVAPTASRRACAAAARSASASAAAACAGSAPRRRAGLQRQRLALREGGGGAFLPKSASASTGLGTLRPVWVPKSPTLPASGEPVGEMHPRTHPPSHFPTQRS